MGGGKNELINAVVGKVGENVGHIIRIACKITFTMKKDGNKRFCGDYRPLNTQTQKDAYPMSLIDDVLSQMGYAEWFIALDLHSVFW